MLPHICSLSVDRISRVSGYPHIFEWWRYILNFWKKSFCPTGYVTSCDMTSCFWLWNWPTAKQITIPIFHCHGVSERLEEREARCVECVVEPVCAATKRGSAGWYFGMSVTLLWHLIGFTGYCENAPFVCNGRHGWHASVRQARKNVRYNGMEHALCKSSQCRGHTDAGS